MKRIAPLLALVLLSASLLASAQGVLKPVPAGDLSKVSKETATLLTQARRDFEAAKVPLLGAPLAEAYAKLGALYARYGVFTVADAALDNAVAIAPEDGRFHYLKGVFAGQGGRLPEARAHYERALALDQNYLPIRYRLADTQVRLKDYAGAKRTLEALAKSRPDLAPAPALLGQIALQEKRYAEAIRLFEQSLKADPSASSLYAPLADAYAASGDRTRAQAARAKAGGGIAAFGDPLVQGIYASAPRDPAAQALLLAAQGQHAQARSLLDAALAQAPKDAGLLAAYARVAADAGDLATARARAQAAQQAAPGNANAQLVQGMIQEMSGQDAAAIPSYERAVRADLKLGEARLMLGNAYMRARNFSAATEQYRQLLQIAPQDDMARLRVVAAQSQAGRCGEALAEVNGALRSRPKDGDLLQVFVRLASSCPAARPAERQMALDYAKSLYQQRPDAAHAEAYAMAIAANGKPAEAVDYQAQVIFEAVKAKDDAAAARGRTLLARFESGQAAITPWPANHPLLTPPRLQARAAPAPARAPASPPR